MKKETNYKYYPFSTTHEYTNVKTKKNDVWENRHRSKGSALGSYFHLKQHGYKNPRILYEGKDITGKVEKWLKTKDF